MKITIIDVQQTPVDRALVRRVGRRAAAMVEHSYASVTIALVDDERITELNRAHRGRNRATDVLAYEGGDDTPEYMGDVVVSVETAARQAQEAGRAMDHEVAWLAAHGVLHLLGYDDADEAQRRAMIARQDEALNEGLARSEARTRRRGQ